MRQGCKDRQMMGEGTRRVYRIVVRSELTDRYASAFEGMEMETKNGQTILTGEVKDQPHLFGILDRLNSLGLELLSVQDLSADAHPIAEVIES
jgi:outer membrane PBP1 activator LpoA protein